VHGEAVRQVNLLRLRDELHHRGFTSPETVAVESVEVTDLFATSAFASLRRDAWERWVADQVRRPGFELGAGPFTVRAARLKGLAGTLSWPTQPDCIFANELAGRVRVIAGLDQHPILLHSEKWPDYQGWLQEFRRVRTRLHCESDDAVVVVWGPEEDTMTAVNEVRLRYADATGGIPNETRQPFPDGSTDFERILPGPDRMYPDTDSPPSRVTRERVERLRVWLAPRPWEREARYGAAGVPRDTIHYLIRRGASALVDRVVDEAGADLRQACFLFGERLKGLRRAGVAVDTITAERWCELFGLARERPVLWQAWQPIVRRMAAAPAATVTSIVAEAGLGSPPDGWPERLPSLLDAAAREAYDTSAARLARLAIGKAMAVLRGRVDATEVAAALAAHMEARGTR